jgi:nitrate/TMAO reductase-like tetraheme cytochrome c subunit
MLLTACFPKTGAVPDPVSAADVSAATSKWPNATEASLTSGRDLFSEHCNACHGYPAMTAVAESKWPGTVHAMAKKAHLAAEDEEKVLHFILMARARAAK